MNITLLFFVDDINCDSMCKEVEESDVYRVAARLFGADLFGIIDISSDGRAKNVKSGDDAIKYKYFTSLQHAQSDEELCHATWVFESDVNTVRSKNVKNWFVLKDFVHPKSSVVYVIGPENGIDVYDNDDRLFVVVPRRPILGFKNPGIGSIIMYDRFIKESM